MKVAIRDDDTSYFTKPQELIDAYDFIDNFPISLSVVPFSVKDHTGNKPYGDIDDNLPKYNKLGENAKLVEFLKEGIKNNKYEVLLHGINHEYKLEDNEWIPEMMFKEEQELMSGIENGKNYLEKILDTNINVFVSPSGGIENKGIRAIEKQGLNYSGIIGRHKDRDISLYYIYSYVKRWSHRLITGMPYGGVLNYGKHKELIAYSIDNEKELLKTYKYCKKYDYPFVMYTHYWELNRNENYKRTVHNLVNYAIEDGAKPSFLSECFD